MSKFLISLGIGVAAGLIDAAPMIAQKLDRHATASAFTQWVVLGIFISYIQLPFSPWLKGLLVAELAALPIAILVAQSDPKSIVPILAMSAVLGALVGVTTARFAR